MIRVKIQVNNNAIEDSYDKWGFIFLSADNRVDAPIKAFDEISYIESAGKEIDTRTVADSFEYKTRFLVETPNKDLNNANTKIANFNRALYKTNEQGVREYYPVTIYNPYKRVKIVGIPEPIAELTEFYRDRTDCAVFEFKLKVNNPTLCDFDYKE